MARDYKKIDIYHLSYTFVLDLYKITKGFPANEQNNITSQIRRAAVSIPLNIVMSSIFIISRFQALKSLSGRLNLRG